MRRALRALVVVAVLVAAGPSAGQRLGPAPPMPEPSRPPAPAHPAGELDCVQCHQQSHQGVARMYRGEGGRGAPALPNHMFQLRVECIACHIAPTQQPGAELTGRTFRPSEQACVGCHGDRYRGMMQRWVTTLARMQEILTPKLERAREALAAADAKNPRHRRARQLVEDARFNTGFVAFARGIHNVRYAADLLKLANGWLDEAMVLLGQAPDRSGDALVRGGYCAVLCHEQAGVKLKETVTFAGRKLPHGRHVTEFGAVCTACHSAETHKALTASPASCSGCHHSPLNERCESCHAAQAAFYRGTVKTGLAEVEPNVMKDVVPCTGCHDFNRKHSRQAVGQTCVSCHEPPYLALHGEWTTGFDQDTRKASDAVRRADTALSTARRAGRGAPEADRLLAEARDALALVRRARGAHNPLVADALLETARQKAEAALAQAGRR